MVKETSAIPKALRRSLPAKMISSVLIARKDRTFCSPITHSSASQILLFPLPLGPTTDVTPGANSITVRSAKVLNPNSSRRFRYT